MAKMAPQTKEVLNSITEQQWVEYYNELVVYAVSKCRRLYWRSGTLDNLPKTFSPDAIVREAVARLYSGDRDWNHERYPTVVEFLKSVIDSEVSGLVNGEEHKRSVYLEDQRTRRAVDGDGYEVEVRGSEDVLDLPRYEPLSPEMAAYFSELEQRLHAAIEDRSDLVTFFSYMQAGHSPQEISRLMGMPRESVYQLRKLFDSRTVLIRNELLGSATSTMKAKGEM